MCSNDDVFLYYSEHLSIDRVTHSNIKIMNNIERARIAQNITYIFKMSY